MFVNNKRVFVHRANSCLILRTNQLMLSIKFLFKKSFIMLLSDETYFFDTGFFCYQSNLFHGAIICRVNRSINCQIIAALHLAFQAFRETPNKVVVLPKYQNTAARAGHTNEVHKPFNQNNFSASTNLTRETSFPPYTDRDFCPFVFMFPHINLVGDLDYPSRVVWLTF